MIRVFDYFYIAFTIFFTVYGQLILKWRLTDLAVSLPAPFAKKLIVLAGLLLDPYIFSGIFAAFLASLAWMAALTRFDLNFAYPFMGLNFVLVLALSVMLLGESYSVVKVLGVLLIVSGTVLISQS